MVQSIEIKPSRFIIQFCDKINEFLYPKSANKNHGAINYVLARIIEEHPYLSRTDHDYILKTFKVAIQRNTDGINSDSLWGLVSHTGENGSYTDLFYKIIKLIIPLINFDDIKWSTLFSPYERGRIKLDPVDFFKLIICMNESLLNEYLKKLGNALPVTIGDLALIILNTWDKDIHEFNCEESILNYLMWKEFEITKVNAEILYNKDKIRDYLLDIFSKLELINITKKSNEYIFIDTISSYIEAIFTDEDYRLNFLYKAQNVNYVMNYAYDFTENNRESNSVDAFCMGVALLYKGIYAKASISEQAEFLSQVYYAYYANLPLFKFHSNSDVIPANDVYPHGVPCIQDLICNINRKLKKMNLEIPKDVITALRIKRDERKKDKTRPDLPSPEVFESTCFMPDDELPQYDNFAQVMEAYNKANVTASKAINKGYSAYRKFLNNIKPIDSQLDKLSKDMKDMVLGNERQKIIEGKNYTPWTLVKKLLGGYLVFSASKTIFFLGLLTKYTLGKKCSNRERRKIVSELTTEIELLDEKIEDAKMAGDNKAKYEMMRTRAELKKTLTQIKTGLSVADDKATKKTSVMLGLGINHESGYKG